MAASMLVSENEQNAKELRVVEFFSGVGGLHSAVKGSGIPCSVVAAVEINTVANAVYKHNFPDVNLMQRNLEGFTVEDFSSFQADMFVMSPPCQPFTRVGLKGDKNDARTNAFFNIMRCLPEMPSKPTYILVENVKGFDSSETRNFLVETLERCKYTFQEFLLSPIDIGIPNQRVRYFLLAKQCPLEFRPCQGGVLLQHRVNVQSSQCEGAKSGEISKEELCQASMVSSNVNSCDEKENSVQPSTGEESRSKGLEQSTNSIETELSNQVRNASINDSKVASNECGDETQKRTDESVDASGEQIGNVVPARKIEDYLQTDLTEDSVAEYLIPDKILLKFGHMMDIVTAQDTKTRCFTKAYAYYVEGTGSILRTDLSTEMSEAFQPEACDEEERLRRLRALKLRYFTPREVANLHHFPTDFSFPEGTTKKQLYRLLGNSLNVTLVAELIRYLIA